MGRRDEVLNIREKKEMRNKKKKRGKNGVLWKMIIDIDLNKLSGVFFKQTYRTSLDEIWRCGVWYCDAKVYFIQILSFQLSPMKLTSPLSIINFFLHLRFALARHDPFINHYQVKISLSSFLTFSHRRALLLSPSHHLSPSSPTALSSNTDTRTFDRSLDLDKWTTSSYAERIFHTNFCDRKWSRFADSPWSCFR